MGIWIRGGSFVELNGLGHMRGHPKIAAPSSGAQNGQLARDLWDLSASLTGRDWPVGFAVAM